MDGTWELIPPFAHCAKESFFFGYEDVRYFPYSYKLVLAYSVCFTSAAVGLSDLLDLVRSRVSSLALFERQVCLSVSPLPIIVH